MLLRTILRNLVKVVIDEAERNPKFAEQLWVVFESAMPTDSAKPTRPANESDSRIGRPSNRRPPSVLDPVALAAQGEEILRAELEPLTLEQLKDIVADYGMDREKLVMKWKTPNRVIERIVEIAVSRAHKGEAFRS